MATVIRMPSVLAGTTEAALANWLVKRGDTVAVGTPIAEIETEKALVEYAAEEAGIVGRLVLGAGDSGEIGDPIAVLVAAGETDADIDAALGVVASAPAGPAAPSPAPPPPAPPLPASGAPPSGSIAQMGPVEARVRANDTSAVGTGAAGGRVFASPLVRKLAGERGVDLVAVTGTGPNGRIVRRDLERWLTGGSRPAAPDTAAPAPAAPAPAAPAVAVTGGAEHGTVRDDSLARRADGATLIPHTPMRRAIARRLTESKATTPHFYLVTECVVDELLALRARVNQAAAVKVSVNDFVVMAVAAAFRDVPEANVTWSEEGLLAQPGVDLAIAVATDGGLVTPVLRGVERLRLSEIARAAADLAERARSKRLKQHEIEGGTFSVSNLGMYGTVEFSAIINPPQSGILAVGAARKQPVVTADGSVAVATVMRCTLSVDHRAIDGALAARWLSAFTTRLENPLGAII
jgi:pyruvate dehydrogenase E2 component (dihydrolipoyllysine-residue acetyltransferase)